MSWKAVQEYENRYEVSDSGEVRSIDRSFLTKLGKIEHRKQRVIKQFLKSGYLQVGLCKKNVTRWFIVHRLVALAFIPKVAGRCQVNHINGIKTDNRVENLEWVSPKENQLHALKNGLMRSKNKAVQCIETKKIFKSINEAARQINGKAYGVCHVLSGRQKRYMGYSFKFVNKSGSSL